MIGVGLSLTQIAVRTRVGGIASGETEVSDFAISGPSLIAEGDSGPTNVTFTVNRTGYTAGAGSVAWAATGLSADDYVGGVVPSGVVNFEAGDTVKTITVQIQGDQNLEADETLTITLANPATTGSLSVASASTTIVNDDTYDVDAVALFARMSNAPAATQRDAISRAITVLKRGPWSKLDAYWRADTGVDDQAARLNWRSSSYNLTAQGSPGFVQGRDGYWSVDGSSSYLKSGYNPSTVGGQWTVNSTLLLAESADEIAAASATPTEAGSATVDTARLKMGYVNGTLVSIGAMRLNGTTAISGTVNVGTLRGAVALNRQATSLVETYSRGKLINGPTSNAPTAVPTSEITFGFQNNVYTAKTFRAAAIGGGMSASDMQLLQAASIVARHGYKPVMLHLFVGQSNMAGRGTFDGAIDTSMQGVFHWGCRNYRNYTSQTAALVDYDAMSGECLNMGDMDNNSAANLQTALPILKRLKTQLPQYHHVGVLCAVGGTGIVDDGTGSAAIIWNTAVSGRDRGYIDAKARANAAMSWLSTYWDLPGENPSVFGGIYWIQGEYEGTNSNLAATGLQASYYTALSALIAGLRSGITGAANAPFVIGSMCQSFISGTGAKAVAIDAAHQQAAANLTKVSYRAGGTGDGLHYYAAEQRTLGSGMADDFIARM